MWRWRIPIWKGLVLTCRRSDQFSGVRGNERAFGKNQICARQLHAATITQRRRNDDGPHSSRLEPRNKTNAGAQGIRSTGGAYIVYESIIDDDRSVNAFGLLMSLNMLIETSDAFDYTGADCSGWMKEAGFRETRVEHLVGPDSMVIGIK